MNELFSSNRFIKHFNELQEALEDNNLIVFSDYKPPKKKLFEKREEPENKFKDILKEKVTWFVTREFRPDRRGEDADYIRGYTLDFNQLWDFCQFVRYAEKVIFFENDIDNDIFVSSSLSDIDTRKFIVKYNEKVNITLTLEKQSGVNNETLRIIKLEVIRNYGKMLKNEYVIVDENIDRLDISDSILIMNINRIIYKHVVNTYISIIEKFLGSIEEAMKWTTEDYYIFRLSKLEETLSEYV